MAVYLRIDDEDGLGWVNDLIHDGFFEVSDVRFDPDMSTVTIPFTQARVDNWLKLLVSTSKSAPDFDGRLILRQVNGMSLKDKHEVGSYDFNELTFDAQSHRLKVMTGIPLELEMVVKSIDISVELRHRQRQV